MAQRATGFAKRTPAPEQPAVQERVPLPIEESEPPDPVPLDLAPLVAPYRKRGRVTVRIERLPHRARLNQGQNNGDRSWSLALDQLDGLEYLPPTGDETRALSIRIIRVDAGDAQTLALLDYPLPAAPEAPAPRAAGASDAKELRSLREELARAKAALAVREAELAQARRTAEESQAELSRQTIEEELAAMRASWQAEIEERLALAARDAAANLEKQRAEWQARADARVARAESRAQERSGDAQERIRREVAEAVAAAEREWKTAEAARLAEAESRWKRIADKAAADARAEFERSRAGKPGDGERARTDAAELQRLKSELAQARSALEDRDRQLARAEADAAAQIEKAQAKWQAEAARAQNEGAELRRLRSELDRSKSLVAERERELARIRTEADGLRQERDRIGRVSDELSRSKSALSERDEEIARLQADLDRLHLELETTKSSLIARDQELARSHSTAQEARSEAETLRSDSAELRRASTELSNAKALLAVRDAEIARMRSGAEEARRRWREESESLLANAEKAWKAAEADRLAAAEAGWREQSQKAVDDALERTERAETALHEEVARNQADRIEAKRLADEVARLKLALSEREGELVKARIGHDEARARWQKETEAAIARAQASWKAAEAERFAASQAQSGDETMTALADMTAKVKKLELALEDSRNQVETLRRRGDSDDVRRLRHELSSLQAALANRDAELLKLRTDHEIDRARWTQEARVTLQSADRHWHEEEAEDSEARAQAEGRRRMVRGTAMLLGFLGLAISSYFVVGPMVSEHSGPLQDLIQPVLEQANISLGPAVVPVPDTDKKEALPVATIVKSAKLRAGPSTTADVIATLPTDAKVGLVGHDGNWIHVQVSAPGAPIRQGWVYKTVIAQTPPATPPAAPAH